MLLIPRTVGIEHAWHGKAEVSVSMCVSVLLILSMERE